MRRTIIGESHTAVGMQQAVARPYMARATMKPSPLAVPPQPTNAVPAPDKGKIGWIVWAKKDNNAWDDWIGLGTIGDRDARLAVQAMAKGLPLLGYTGITLGLSPYNDYSSAVGPTEVF